MATPTAYILSKVRSIFWPKALKNFRIDWSETFVRWHTRTAYSVTEEVCNPKIEHLHESGIDLARRGVQACRDDRIKKCGEGRKSYIIRKGHKWDGEAVVANVEIELRLWMDKYKF